MYKIIKALVSSIFVLTLLLANSASASRTVCGTFYDDYKLPILGYDEISGMVGYNSSFWSKAKSDITFSSTIEQLDFTNTDTTGARIMAALWLLKNAGDGNTPVLDEAYGYVASRIDSLRVKCNVGSSAESVGKNRS